MTKGNDLEILLEKMSVDSMRAQSAGFKAVIWGRSSWLGHAAVDEEAQRLSPDDMDQLLNNTKMMARLGADRFGLERLSSLLGLKAFSYAAGFWNYFPTTHDNLWKFSPLILTNYSLAWKVRYWMADWGLIDPAIRIPIQTRQVCLWRTRDFQGPAYRLGIAAQREGVHEGVTLPIFGMGSEVAHFAFVSSPVGFLSAQDLYDNRAGLTVFAETFHGHAFKSYRDQVRKRIRLTPREMEVLSLVVSGARNTDIASSLSIGKSGVQKHLDNLCHKFGVENRHDIAPEAIALGITGMAPYEAQ